MWQLSGAHGYKADLQSSLIDMKSLVDAGFVTFDLADHYGPLAAKSWYHPLRRLKL